MGKNAERRVARMFGKERTGPTGMDDNDFIHPLIAPEVKWRTKLPLFLLNCLKQAKSARSAGNKVPVVFTLQKGMRLQDGLVTMRIGGFEELFGQIDQLRPQELDDIP